MSRSIIAPTRRVNLIPHGIVAGIIGGILIDLFLLWTRAGRVPTVYHWIASGVVGTVAYSSPSYAWLGLALHFAVSMAWGAIYAFLCQRIGTPALDRPIATGIIFGIVVWTAMQATLVIVRLWQPPASALALFNSVVHTVFFGIPIAWYLRTAVRRRLPA